MSLCDFMKPICNKCGKVAPIDEEESNESWVVHRTDIPCECGGKYIPKGMIMIKDTVGGDINV